MAVDQVDLDQIVAVADPAERDAALFELPVRTAYLRRDGTREILESDDVILIRFPFVLSLSKHCPSPCAEEGSPSTGSG